MNPRMPGTHKPGLLITGGLGFIGGCIAERCTGATIIDNLSTAVYAPREFDHLGHHVYVQDIQDWQPTPGWPYQRVIHCASPVGAVGVIGQRGKIASQIAADTQRVVDWCLAWGAELVYVSSSEVYGRSGTYRETDALRVPAQWSARIEYAIGKMAGEACVRLTPGLRAVVVRPFNVAGARQLRDAGFVLPTFAQQALADVPLTVFGDGSQRRAFTAVQDVARFIEGLQAEHFTGQVCNVGNPWNVTSISHLAALVRRLADSSSSVHYTTGKAVHGPLYEEAEGHVKLPTIDPALATGWEPQIPLEQIVADTVAHERATYTAQLSKIARAFDVPAHMISRRAQP